MKQQAACGGERRTKTRVFILKLAFSRKISCIVNVFLKFVCFMIHFMSFFERRKTHLQVGWSVTVVR